MKPTVSRNRLFRTNYHQINSPITSDHPICSNWQESFPKKWKFDELDHSTASGDKYYWHLSWRSWHCSPNIYQTGGPITILSVKKRQIKFTWPTQKKSETLLNVGLRIHMNLIMNQLQPHTYASMKVWLLRFEGYLKMPELNQRKGIIAS